VCKYICLNVADKDRRSPERRFQDCGDWEGQVIESNVNVVVVWRKDASALVLSAQVLAEILFLSGAAPWFGSWKSCLIII